MLLKPILALYLLLISLSLSAQTPKIDLLILGSDHLAQIYNKDFPTTDILMPRAQDDIKKFSSSFAAYKADMVMVEVLPNYQQEIDSLYSLFIKDKLELHNLPDGRSEVYQIAFRIAKQSNINKIHCVNAPGGTSQGILENGHNIGLYKDFGSEVRSLAVSKLTGLRNGALSFSEYLAFLNQPDIANMIHKLRYVIPARVTNGKFKNPDAMVDTAFINPRFIGAELTSVFKNRDYKIYSNIVTAQMEQRSMKILLVIGVAHIGSLKSIFRDDDEYNIVDALKYIKK
jgi:hypothetical protein